MIIIIILVNALVTESITMKPHKSDSVGMILRFFNSPIPSVLSTEALMSPKNNNIIYIYIYIYICQCKTIMIMNIHRIERYNKSPIKNKLKM